MIKKINKLIDDMPFIIKLILGIIMTGIITLCFFIIGVVQVNAQAIDYNSGANYIHKIFPTQEFIQFGRGVDFSLNSTNAYDKVNIQWTNYQAGVADIAIVLKLVSGTLATYNCNDIYQMFSVVENGQDTGATYRRKECRITGNEIDLKLYWRTTLEGGANSYMEVQLNRQFSLATVVNAYGVMTVNSIDPATNTDIQDQTNALINNNNSNTQLITNAVDNSTNTIINQMQDNLNMRTCEIIDKNDKEYDGYLYDNGQIGTNLQNQIVTKYIKIDNTSNITKIENTLTDSAYRICFYDYNKDYISCLTRQQYYEINEIPIPSNANYVRFTINTISNVPQYKVCNIQDRTQAEIDYYKQFISQLSHQSEWDEEDDEVKNGLLRNIISGIGNIFGFLGDDELDDPDDALSDLSSNMGTNNVISSLLLLPVSIYQSVVNNINGTCNNFNLGSLYNHNLTMTCVRPQDYLGTALWGVIDVIISGIFVLHIRKKFVDIFNHFTSLRTGGNELE